MFDALYIGATGMQAQQQNVDTIANNLVNATTTGYKKGRVSFSDLMVRETMRQVPTVRDGDSGVLGAIPRTGVGVGVASMYKSFETGDLKKTDAPYDLAIQGDGFLEVMMPDGSRAFTRGGSLKVNSDGQLVTQTGNVLKPAISIPDNAQSLIISSDGKIQVKVGNQAKVVDVGQLEMVRFTNTQGLLTLGDNLYRSSENSGEPISGKAGEDGMGTLVQGFLEGSNVKMVDEMVNLMLAQRTYEASVKVVQASDEMLGMVNALRR